MLDSSRFIQAFPINGGEGIPRVVFRVLRADLTAVASAVYRYARVTNESSSNYYAVATFNNAAANTPI